MDSTTCNIFPPSTRYHFPTFRASPRFYNSIWLIRHTMTNESIIGMSRHIIGVKTITRQVYYPAKYNKYLTVVVNAYPLTSATPAPAIQLGTLPPANPKATNYTIAAKSTVGQKATSTQTCHDHHHRFRVN